MFWYLLLGMVIGVVAALFGVSRLVAGDLKVFIPDFLDEQPYLCVDLDRPVSAISAKQYVVFRVDTQKLNTRK